jgi:hypothetical protein
MDRVFELGVGALCAAEKTETLIKSRKYLTAEIEYNQTVLRLIDEELALRYHAQPAPGEPPNEPTNPTTEEHN